MTAFFDSSAVVKLFVPEEHHQIVRAVAGPRVIAQVTVVEVAAAWWRKHRLGELDVADVHVLVDGLRAALGGAEDTGDYVVVGLHPVVVDRALDVLARHSLRGYDAVQLATALVAREAAPEITAFVTFDRALHAAADAEGFSTVPPHLDG